jgi:cytochrome P450
MPTTISRGVDEQLDLLLASDPAAMADPHAVWARLREDAPVHRHDAVVLVSDYASVKELARDRRLSNRDGIDGTLFAARRARLNEEQRAAQAEVASFEALYLVRSDGSEHARLREAAHRAFTPRRIALLEETLQRSTDELLSGLPTDAPIDFRAEIAYPLPMTAITDMLGVPKEDRAMIHGWTRRLGRNRGGDDPVALMEAHDAMQRFRRYVEGILIPMRNARPESDLLSALLGAAEEDRLTDRELTAMFVVLLFAGHETTTNLLATGMLELLHHPEQWSLLKEDPERMPLAVEELLRWVSPVQWMGRVAATDLEIGGVPVAQGESVFLVLAAANRDPRRFADADVLDVTREDSRHHLALGFGPHFCLGNALARLEGALILGTLARRFPDVRLAGDPSGWQGNAMLRGLRDLPLVLGGDRG